MSDLVWLLLWAGSAGYVCAAVLSAMVTGVGYALCVVWRRLRRRVTR
jgi:hypothetical protein